MRGRGGQLAWALALGVAMAASSAAAQESASRSASAAPRVLVAPVQGSEALRVEHGERVSGAVARALGARGFQELISGELLGEAVVACQTPECVEQALDAAGAAFAIVPAIWLLRSGGEELTLTLVQRSGRSLNASEELGRDLPVAAARLVDELSRQRAAAVATRAAGVAAPTVMQPVLGAEVDSGPVRPHAWKAGPAVLIAGGTAAVVTVGVAAGIRSDTQQVNGAAAAAWLAVGAAAIGGGVAWWVVGEKRRRKKTRAEGALAPTMALHPTGIDLRLRF